MPTSTVNIRPGVTVLSVLRHLNYRPWFALSEFIDNSIQSFLDHRSALQHLEGPSLSLRVDLEIDSSDSGRIVVRDNAAGIHERDFARAFRPAELPPDTTGLAEFGMGMKSAACWFAPEWTVRTSALGEAVERCVEFNISRIVQDELEELDVDTRDVARDTHFTEIVLTHLHRPPIGRTLGKIKDHLRDIYRIFTREGLLALSLNGELLTHEQPGVLVAPHFRTPNGTAKTWRKDFDFDFGDGLRAHGFAAIRQRASTSRAGFALFRRRRLIQGSGDDGYRPEYIFGKPNSFVYQRVFGEIHLEGFDVSHTKDGFQWDENEHPFLELLKEELSQNDLPLLPQAREYRVERRRRELQEGAEEAVARTAETVRDYVPPVLSDLCDQSTDDPAPRILAEAETAARRTIDVELRGRAWRIVIELSTDPAVGDWLEISDHIAEQGHSEESERRVVGLRLALAHPFMQRFCGADSEEIEPLLRVAAALGLAELAARDSGVRMAGTIRRNINDLLRNALWRT